MCFLIIFSGLCYGVLTGGAVKTLVQVLQLHLVVVDPQVGRLDAGRRAGLLVRAATWRAGSLLLIKGRCHNAGQRAVSISTRSADWSQTVVVEHTGCSVNRRQAGTW